MTIWTDEKQRWEESEKKVRRESQRREKKKKDINEEKVRESQRKKTQVLLKGRKVVRHCVFPMICGSGGSKSRLARATGAEPSGQMRDDQVHAVVARSAFPNQKCKQVSTFGRSDVECSSQHVQNTPCSVRFWKLREREREREIDRQTGRQTDRQIDG